jgi:hypothetical protein
MAPFKKAHIDQLLTNYSQKYSNAAFIGETLFPEVKVEKESDLYAIYGLEMFNVYEAKRANGARSSEIDWTITNARYACEQYSLSSLVTDREKDNADKPITVEIDTTELVQDTLALSKEYRAAQIARNAASYVNGNTAPLAGGSRWDQYSTSNPLADIKTAKKAVWTASRKTPNTIVIPTQVGLEMALHPDLLDLRKYTDPRLLTDSGLPPVLQGMKVVEAGAGYNSANAGQTASLADVWGKDVILAYVDPRPKVKALTYGVTFRVNRYVRKWRVEEREGDMVEVNDINTLAQIATGCGYLLQTVIS